MKELYLNRNSPFLHPKARTKFKAKPITDRKSRNLSSLNGINDTKLKELLMTYLHTQPSHSIHSARSGFCSIDKNNQVTLVPSKHDIGLHKQLKYNKLYPHQMRTRNMRLRQNNNNNNNTKGNNQLAFKRNSNHYKTESMFDFVNALKPQMQLSTRSRDASSNNNNNDNNTVMNIVNNLNGDTLSQSNLGNKNVEINFNKYEIRILSNKKESSANQNIEAIKECVSKEIENKKKDNYHSNKDNDDVLIVHTDKGLNEDVDIGRIVIQGNKTKAEDQNKNRNAIVSKQVDIANEDNNVGDNIISSKEPKKITHLFLKKKSILRKAVLEQTNEAIDINNNKDNDNKGNKAGLINKAIINNNIVTNNSILISPQFHCNMSVSNQNTFSFQGKQKISEPNPNTEKKKNVTNKTNTLKEEDIIKSDSIKTHSVKASSIITSSIKEKETIKEEKESKANDDDNIISIKPLNHISQISKLKLNANYNIMHSPSKRSIQSIEEDSSRDNNSHYCLSSPRKEVNKFWRKKAKLSSRTDGNNNEILQSNRNQVQLKLIDSSDLVSQDEEDPNPIITHSKSTSVNSNYIFSNLQLQVKNLKKNLANRDHTSTEATNTYSAKNSSDINKTKDNLTFLLSSLKRAKSNISLNHNGYKNPKSSMSPKKNKRFLRQLSKISEISSHNRKNRNQKKDKLIKSTSLPLIPIGKISNVLENIKLERQSSSMNLTNKMILRLSYHNSFEISQKDVIKEEQLSDSHHSKVSSSSSSSSISNQTKTEIKKMPSVRSISTGGINFFEMKANSIHINAKLSKCLSQDNRTYCKSFIEKFINELKHAHDDIDSYSTEAKNDLLHKTILTIDLKCERLNDIRRKTHTQWANDTICNLIQWSQLNVQSFVAKNPHHIKTIDFDGERDGNEEREKDVINEYGYYSNLLHIQLFYKSSILSLPFYDQYFPIDILENIQKGNYLDNNYYEGEMSIISNFAKAKKTYKKLKTSLSIWNPKSFQKTNTVKMVKKKPVAPVINLYEYFKFIQIDDVPSEDKTDKKVEFALFQNSKKSSSTPRKTFNRKNSKIFIKKKTSIFKKSITRLSNMSRKSFDENSMVFSNNINRRDSVLHKKFYLRQRNSINNYNFKNNKSSSFYHKIEANNQKRAELYMSPLKLRNGILNTSKKNTIIVKNFLHFNKETMMFKTYEIKTKLLTEMGNYIDTLFFYIKDSNFHNFKDMFLKHKVSPEVQDKDGNSFLNVAVQSGSDKIVIFLLNSGSNVNTQNKLMNSPLHYALSYKNFALADILIKFGADEKLKNRYNKTPWECLNDGNSIT